MKFGRCGAPGGLGFVLREELRGFCLGLVWDRSRGYVCSSATYERETLTNLLAAFGRMWFGSTRPFLAIQCNKAQVELVSCSTS